MTYGNMKKSAVATSNRSQANVAGMNLVLDLQLPILKRLPAETGANTCDEMMRSNQVEQFELVVQGQMTKVKWIVGT
jgi:hypothetical protein